MRGQSLVDKFVELLLTSRWLDLSEEVTYVLFVAFDLANNVTKDNLYYYTYNISRHFHSSI